MIRSVIVAGGAGFIGSHFARLLLDLGYERVRILDKLTYAGNPENFADLRERPGFSFVVGDICDAGVVRDALTGFDALVNFAAETHVDRSLLTPGSFIATDVQGVWVLLEAVRELGLQRFVQVSTDEVYGEVMSGHVDEAAALQPRNPYSASKAGGDLLVRSYFASFGLPVLITRGSNTYGPSQYPEKFLLAHLVLAELGAGNDLIEFVDDRPGHDRRYAMDWAKLGALDWQPAIGIEQGIRETVRWYVEQHGWWEALRADPDYRRYHDRNYGSRKTLARETAVAE